jgi:hypothetical protein
MFPHCKIHKFTLTSPDGKTHNQTDQILIDRRRHSSVLDVRSFRGGQTAILNIIWWWQKLGRLAVSKRTTQKLNMERFNLKKLNEVDGKNSNGLKSKIGLQLWKT